MIPAQPDDGLTLRIETRADTLFHATDGTFVPFTLPGQTFDFIQHLVKATDKRKHRVLFMPPRILAIQ